MTAITFDPTWFEYHYHYVALRDDKVVARFNGNLDAFYTWKRSQPRGTKFRETQKRTPVATTS